MVHEQRYLVHSFDDTHSPFEFTTTASAGVDLLASRLSVQQDVTDTSVYTGSMGTYLVSFLLDSIGIPVHERATLQPFPNVHRRLLSRPTFLLGDAAFFAMKVVSTEGLEGVEELVDIADTEITENELFFGKAGFLYALLFVRKCRPEIFSSNFDSICTELVREIIEAGRLEGKGHLQWRWHGKKYLGAAHGTAGILYILLASDLADEYMTELKYTLDYMVDNFRFLSGNFHVTADSGDHHDRLVHFCHGATGFVPLLILAARKFPSFAAHYRTIAEVTGDVVWQRGFLITKGPGLCHGVGGSILALLDLYDFTDDLKWLHRAQHFCMNGIFMYESLIANADHPASLFEGGLGFLYAVTLTLHPRKLELSRFPGLGFI
jgi:hypothetical protein